MHSPRAARRPALTGQSSWAAPPGRTSMSSVCACQSTEMPPRMRRRLRNLLKRWLTLCSVLWRSSRKAFLRLTQPSCRRWCAALQAIIVVSSLSTSGSSFWYSSCTTAMPQGQQSGGPVLRRSTQGAQRPRAGTTASAQCAAQLLWQLSCGVPHTACQRCPVQPGCASSQL